MGVDQVDDHEEWPLVIASIKVAYGIRNGIGVSVCIIGERKAGIRVLNVEAPTLVSTCEALEGACIMLLAEVPRLPSIPAEEAAQGGTVRIKRRYRALASIGPDPVAVRQLAAP